jgi:hypothetical protein
LLGYSEESLESLCLYKEFSAYFEECESDPVANTICPRLPRFDRNAFLKTRLNLKRKNVVSPLTINVHNAGGESTLETLEKNYEVLACGIRK